MGGKTELVRVDGPGPGAAADPAGRQTAAVEAQVRSFYQSVAQIFERWVTRRSSAHTQRAYRQDVLSFVEFLESLAGPRTRPGSSRSRSQTSSRSAT